MDRRDERPEGYERRWWILAVLCLSLFVIGLDNTILNVAIPTLMRDLNASNSQVQWMVDAYILVFAGLLLTAGSTSDRLGRRLVLQIGLVVFGAGSVACALASTPGMLIGFRAVMGLGGAMIMPSTLSILTNVFPPDERGRAIGIWAGVSGLGIGLGPMIGGYMLDHFWWGSVFLLNVPVVITAVVAGHLIVPNTKDVHAPRIDPIGLCLSIAGLGSLVYGIIEAPRHGWTDPLILLCFGIAAVVLTAFVAWELHSDHPMLNVRFFENPRFTAANISVTLVFFAMFGSMFFMSQYLQLLLGYTPLQAGMRIAPLALVILIVAPTTGMLVRRLGNKVLVTAGMIVVASGLFWMSHATLDWGYGHVLVTMIVVGSGMSLAMTPATESIMGSLPKEKAGVGSAMNDTTRQVGGALGVAILGSIFDSAYTGGFGTALSRLPAALAEQVRRSFAEALGVAKGIGGAAGGTIAQAASSSFIHAMDRGLLIGSFIALGGSLVALLFLPNRAEPEAEEVARMEEVYAGHHHVAEHEAVPIEVGAVAPADDPER